MCTCLIVVIHNCAYLWYLCILGLHSGRVALTSHQTNPLFVWRVGDSGNCHSPCACRIRQARMYENANRSFETVICQLMVNVYIQNCGNSTGNSTANTCIRDLLARRGLPLPVNKPTQIGMGMRTVLSIQSYSI